MKRLLVLSALAFAAALPASEAFAQTATNTLTVSANVLGYCTIDAAALAFGDYDPASATDLDANTTVTVNCTQGSSFWIGLGQGSSHSGTTRQMASGTNLLAYELYRAGYADVWDEVDPAPAIPHVAAANAGLSAYTDTIFGRIPAGQIVAAGAYTDSVLMTVNF